MARSTPLLALALALACAPRMLPGTEIRDTPDNRAIYEVLRSYQQALERRDAPAILALVAPDYFDNAGSPDPSDDIDRARLEQTLPADLAKLEGVRIESTLRGIQVHGDEATAEVFYQDYYRVQTPSGPVPRRDSDLHQLHLKKIQGAWKIVSGL